MAVSVIKLRIASPIISSRRVNPRVRLEVRRKELSGLMRRWTAYPVPLFRQLFAAMEVEACVEDDTCCSGWLPAESGIHDGISQEGSALSRPIECTKDG